MNKSAVIILLFVVAALPADRACAQLPSGTWQLQWADEFTRSSLDTVKGWSFNYPWGATHNHEAYMDLDNVTFGDGTLTITAERQSQGGKPFTSGAVSTGYTNFTVNGGYIEARILLPDTPGSWPAFWGLYSGWPPESDIMEYPIDTAAGSCCGQDQYNTAFHYTNSSGGNSSGGALANPGGVGDLGGTYHNFGMRWVEDTSVAFFFDGAQVSSFGSGTDVAEMVYMYLILNYAVGGWPGTPNTSEWPSGHTDEMKVDWVRIWKETGTSSTNWTYSGTSEDVQWSTSANWSNGSPDLGGVTANFSTVTPAEQRLDWSGERTISHMNFDGATRYVVGFSNDRLLLVGSNNASGNATITVQSASSVQHTIRAEAEMWSNLSITNHSSQPLVLESKFFGNRGINVDGAGPVIFANANVYTGDTVIDSGSAGPGVARVTVSNPFSTGAVTIGSSGNSTSARLELENNTSVPNNIGFNGRNDNGQELVGILNRSGNNTISGAITANVGGSIYQIQSDAGQLTLSGGISAASGTRTITLQGPSNGIVSGVISNGGGTLSIAKEGAGIWTLTGANTYTGGTMINGGRLRANNTSGSGTGAGAVTVNSGGILGGSGFINTSTTNASVTVNAGGGLAPGVSAAGTLTFALGAGSLNLSAVTAGGLKFDLGPPSAPSSSDHVVVNSGTLDIGTLDFSDFAFFNLFGAGPGTYKLFDSQLPIVGSIGNASGAYVGIPALLRLDNTNFDIFLDVGVPGDYNANNVVDAADYVLWRDGGTLQNDPSPGNQSADYDYWRARFGNPTPGSGGGAGNDNVTVPEPAMWPLVVLGMVLILANRFRHDCRSISSVLHDSRPM